MQKTLRMGLLAAWLILGSTPVWAQWATQSLTLQPGWNAVYLEVQPAPADCDTVFSNLPVESVWGWNRRFSPVQYIQNASQLVPTNSDWLFYFPATNKLSGEISLFNLQGGHCYLIKRPDNAPVTTWVISGQPSLQQMQWVPNSFNLAGFSLDRTNPPTFQTFLSGSSALAGNPIFRLSNNGLWNQVANPATTTMRSGEAFWVQCNGVSTYQGPVSVNVAQRTGLTYGRGLVEQTVTIQNASPVARTIQITPLTSGSPVGTNSPALAGPVPLRYWKLDRALNVAGWFPLTGTLTQSNVPPGQSVQLRVEVSRPEMTNYAGAGNALYQSLLEVRDAAGSSRVVIPVSAQGLQSRAASAAVRPFDLTPQPLHPGLWIGNVSLNLVNQPSSDNPDMPTNTPAPFQFRIILHEDSAGQVKLMQRVLQMWQTGTYKPDTNNPANQVVDQPGQFVLLTDESLIPTIPRLTGAAVVDGQPVGRRFSTAAFAFHNPIVMTGLNDFGTAGSTFTCQVTLDYDDPLNPFKHKYHPDHDNLDAHFDANPILPEGQESFTVIRQIQLQFTDKDPDNLGLSGWGDNQLGGIYTETVTGLHQHPLFVQGSFRLQQASRTSTLNANQ